MKYLRDILKESKPLPPGDDTHADMIPRSGDERKFVDMHDVDDHEDRMGNGDEVFKGTAVKVYDRKPHYGYMPQERPGMELRKEVPKTSFTSRTDLLRNIIAKESVDLKSNQTYNSSSNEGGAVMSEAPHYEGKDTLSHVRKALTKSGYSHEGIIGAKFSHINKHGDEVHKITYKDPDHPRGVDTGHVYVDRHGKAEF